MYFGTSSLRVKKVARRCRPSDVIGNPARIVPTIFMMEEQDRTSVMA